MTVAYIVKNLQLYPRNALWLQSDIPLYTKLGYYPHVFAALIRWVFTKKKVVHYLGHQFYYDNPATPLALQYYPHEIKQKIIDNIPDNIEHILDIGGNLGHFSVTAHYYLPQATIDVFEPNPEVFQLLRRNVKPLKSIRAFNRAVAARDPLTFYFEPNRTGTGSLISDNASEDMKNVVEIEVRTTKDITKETRRKAYDLVKIDVEGYEFEVIKLLKNIRPAYLFVEISGLARTKDYTHSELFAAVQKQWGKFDILYDPGADASSNTMDILLGFK